MNEGVSEISEITAFLGEDLRSDGSRTRTYREVGILLRFVHVVQKDARGVRASQQRVDRGIRAENQEIGKSGNQEIGSGNREIGESGNLEIWIGKSGNRGIGESGNRIGESGNDGEAGFGGDPEGFRGVLDQRAVPVSELDHLLDGQRWAFEEPAVTFD